LSRAYSFDLFSFWSRIIDYLYHIPVDRNLMAFQALWASSNVPG